MTYAEAIDFLYNLRLFGTKLGLENTFTLARLNGNPQERLRFIHVAGTNGKGSTCAILESIYRAQGLRTALFTSPHLVSFTERMQVNRTPISEEAVARLVSELIRTMGAPDLSEWPFRPTFFEFVTVMALLYFEQQQCELVIWETGMGGRLDATNIVTPLASVITNVQYDHQQWLGSTLEAIAAEKAGIIKAARPVITGAAEPALGVVRERARTLNAPLTVVDEPAAMPMEFPLLGEHQRFNAAVALGTIDVLQSEIPVSATAIKQGLSTVQWPGRLQRIVRANTEIVLDGAHNPDGARALAAALQTHFAGRAFTLVLGLFGDKSWMEMCEILVPLAARALLVPVPSPRSADLNEVRSFCAEKWPHLRTESCESIAAAINQCASDPLVVVTGSLHLIGEVMEFLHVSGQGRSERALNEWNAGRKGNI